MPEPGTPHTPDKQQVEIIGRSHLIAHLTLGGIEIARPERDKGIDLVAYVDTRPNGFLVSPLQIKASRKPRVGTWAKYNAIPSLLMVFVWVPEGGPVTIVAMTQAETMQLAHDVGWTQAKKWRRVAAEDPTKLAYTTEVTPKIRPHLTEFTMTPDMWVSRMRRAQTGSPG